MAVPRPVLLALLGFALIVSALLATRGIGGNETVTAPSTPSSTPRVAQAPAQTKKPAATQPAQAKRTGHAHAKAHHKAPVHKAAPKPASATGKAAVKKLPTGVSAGILPVVHALAKNQVVVLFFSQSGSADDTLTRSGVQALKGVKGVAVFNAGIKELPTYRPILANVGVSQVPAVVIIRPGHKAQLLEGFTDQGSLRQAVADALR
jgi:hypothetical protein